MGVLNINDLNGTETEKNLFRTFAVECRTNNIYIMFAEKARNEGYSNNPISWVCMNCGYIHEGEMAPNNCPCCGYPKAYFKPKCNPE